MANAQRIAGGFPFPVYVNETIAAAGGSTRPVKMAGEWGGYAGAGGGFAG